VTNQERDKQFEVVWTGGDRDGLIGDRDSKPNVAWSPLRRAYNYSGKYIGLFKGKKVKAMGNDDPEEPKIDTFGDGEN
jgi:hypothetical protein